MSDADRPDQRIDAPDILTVAELADRAEVSVRTVRYYISEGLLPPPHGGGPTSHYDQIHLDRLRLIGRLKEAYLPLREIRRRLTGLSPAGIRAALDETPSSAPSDSAADYLARLAPPAPPARAMTDAVMTAPSLAPPSLEVYAAPVADASISPKSPPDPEYPSDATELGEPWRRIRIGDDVELLIRAAAYIRLRDRVEWLVRWAEQVFR